jgi:hypothetical protein
MRPSPVGVFSRLCLAERRSRSPRNRSDDSAVEPENQGRDCQDCPEYCLLTSTAARKAGLGQRPFLIAPVTSANGWPGHRTGSRAGGPDGRSEQRGCSGSAPAAGARAGRAAAEEGMTGAISVPVTPASRSGRRDRSAPLGRQQASAGPPACSSGALKRVMYHHSGCPRGLEHGFRCGRRTASRGSQVEQADAEDVVALAKESIASAL